MGVLQLAVLLTPASARDCASMSILQQGSRPEPVRQGMHDGLTELPAGHLPIVPRRQALRIQAHVVLGYYRLCQARQVPVEVTALHSGTRVSPNAVSPRLLCSSRHAVSGKQHMSWCCVTGLARLTFCKPASFQRLDSASVQPCSCFLSQLHAHESAALIRAGNNVLQTGSAVLVLGYHLMHPARLPSAP